MTALRNRNGVPGGRVLAATGLFLIASLVAVMAVFAAERGMRVTGLAAICLCLVIAAAILRDAIVLILGVLVVAISYNRQFYSFDAVIGNYGPSGLYWTLADAAMILLLLVAAGVALARRAQVEPRVPRHLSIEPAMLLMIVAMAISALRNLDVVPGIIETFRIAKYLIMFLILRALLTRERFWALLFALMAMVMLQTALGGVQVALSAGGSGLGSIATQEGEMARRATGTLGHPNMYAPFILTFTCGFVLMGIIRDYAPWLRLLSLAAGVGGCLAILMSQSRAPAAGMLLALGGAGLSLMLRGLLPPRRMIGGTLILIVMGALALIPMMDRIVDRLTGDFGGSISFRADYNAAALDIWREAPAFGVGPSGFVPALARHDAVLYGVNEEIQEARLQVNVKTIAPVHNVYLLVLAELGIVGLVAFVLFLTSLIRLFHGASRGTAPGHVFFLGVFWGTLLLFVQQLTDFSLWWDHHMALLVVLAAMAAWLRDSGRMQGMPS